MARPLHVFEVQVVRCSVPCFEDMVLTRSAERFSIRAAGDISAHKIVGEIVEEKRTAEGFRNEWSISSTECYRVVNGVPEKLSTREKSQQRRAQYGYSR